MSEAIILVEIDLLDGDGNAATLRLSNVGFSRPIPVTPETSYELREDGTFELREDGNLEVRE